MIRAFFDPNIEVIYIEGIAITVIPLCLGGYCLWAALRRIPVLLIAGESRNISVSLVDLLKAGEYPAFEKILREKTGAKVAVIREIRGSSKISKLRSRILVWTCPISSPNP